MDIAVPYFSFLFSLIRFMLISIDDFRKNDSLSVKCLLNILLFILINAFIFNEVKLV